MTRRKPELNYLRNAPCCAWQTRHRLQDRPQCVIDRLARLKHFRNIRSQQNNRGLRPRATRESLGCGRGRFFIRTPTSPARHARIAWVKFSHSQTGIRSANLSLDARREICLTMFSSQSSAPQLWCAALTLPPGRTAPCCGIFDSAFPATPRPALALPRPDAAAALRPATPLPAHGRYARLRQVPG